MEARQAALEGGSGKVEIGSKRTVDGTVSHGLVSYYKSTSFTGVAKSSQNMRRAELERFRNEHDDKRVLMMHAMAIQNILNGKTPAVQRNFKKALRGFIDHCLSLKMIKVDPKLSRMKTVGHHPWETFECEQFDARHPIGTRARLAYELLLRAGQSKMRRSPHGSPACPQRHDDDEPSKDRNTVQRGNAVPTLTRSVSGTV